MDGGGSGRSRSGGFRNPLPDLFANRAQGQSEFVGRGGDCIGIESASRPGVFQFDGQGVFRSGRLQPGFEEIIGPERTGRNRLSALELGRGIGNLLDPEAAPEFKALDDQLGHLLG